MVADANNVSTLSDHADGLARLAHADGGWGYAPGQPPHLEPTCLALLALSLERERFGDALAHGQRFLERCAAGDGSYRPADGRDEAVWPTALVLFTQSVLDQPADKLRRSASRLLGVQSRVPDHPEAGE